MKPESRFPIAIILAVVFLLIAELLIYRSDAAEPITPAFTPEQSQASALAVPAPVSAPPASLVVVTLCNNVVGIVAADADGHLHPLNIEGLSEGRVRSIVARVPERIVVVTPCVTEPDRQPIF